MTTSEPNVFEEVYDEQWFEDLFYQQDKIKEEEKDEKKRKAKRQNTRIKLKVRACLYIPNMKQRKHFEQNEIVILLTHIINHYNPVQFIKYELLNNEEKQMFSKCFKECVILPLKDFIKCRLYPYPKEEGLFHSNKLKVKNEQIKRFESENLTLLKDYFNSFLFHKYLQQMNFHATKCMSRMSKKRMTCVVKLLRAKFKNEYL